MSAKKGALNSTVMHTLELLVTFGVSIAMLKILDLDSETSIVVIGIIVSALAKYSRASDIPVKDFVNM